MACCLLDYELHSYAAFGAFFVIRMQLPVDQGGLTASVFHLLDFLLFIYWPVDLEFLI